MRARAILTLVILILLFAAVYVAMSVVGVSRVEAPAEPASGFNGPTGAPYVKGPPGPPQGY